MLQEVQFEKDPAGNFNLPAWLMLDGYGWAIPEAQALKAMAERNKRVLGREVSRTE